MKICQMIHSTEYGGAEYHTLYLAQGLIEKGHEVHLIAPEGSLSKEFKECGVKLFITQPQHDLDWSFINKISAYLISHRIEVVHCHELKLVVNGLIAAKKAKVPVRVAHIHSPLPYWQIPLWKKVPDIVVNSFTVNALATDVIALSYAGRKLRIMGELIRPNLITVIPNGINMRDYQHIDKKQAHKYVTSLIRAKDDQMIIGTLSRLTEEKGLKYAINMMAQINTAHLIIAGEGPLKEELLRQIEDMGLTNKVTLTGFIPEDKRNLYLAGLDAFLFPTLHEGFGYVLIEAMAAKTITLSSDLPVLKEITNDGTYGFHFPLKKPEDMATIVNYVFDHKDECEIKIKHAYLNVMQKYSLEKFVTDYENLYLNRLQGKL